MLTVTMTVTERRGAIRCSDVVAGMLKVTFIQQSTGCGDCMVMIGDEDE